VNITEANAVVTVLHLLDGSTTRKDPQEILNAIDFLVGRVEKPLLMSLQLDTDQLLLRVLDLHQRTAVGSQGSDRSAAMIARLRARYAAAATQRQANADTADTARLRDALTTLAAGYQAVLDAPYGKPPELKRPILLEDVVTDLNAILDKAVI